MSAARAREDDGYAFYSAIDLLGLQTVLGLWEGAAGPPLLTWWSSYASDAAHHGGGPRSAIAADGFIDLDRRLGVLLDRLVETGTLDDTLVLLTADHGFESSDPACRGDWTPALAAALDPLGVPWRDEGPGMLYLGVGP